MMRTPPYLLGQENQLERQYQQLILPYWQQYAELSSFYGVNGLRIHFAKLNAAQPKHQAIVISPGRTEGYLKYYELGYDLAQQGYDIFIIDHRGQGLSDRESPRRQLGDVENFQYFVDDLQQLVQQFVLPCQYQQHFLLAHSMGGTIAARYLQQHPNHFQAVALSAPMFGINLGLLPKPIVKTLAAGLAHLERQFGYGPHYALGQGDYRPSEFSRNHLSHSPARYQQILQTYVEHPAIQLGGPSNRWLQQSFQAMQLSIEDAAHINIPLLLLQAEQDPIVTAEGQNAFFHRLTASAGKSSNAQLMPVIGAKHEIFFESDEIRNPALASILIFFEQHRA
ncbi:alpha/beta fold hydrolase [Agarivorans sp. QJM3NY_33]|uniref:alpha/beta fold hydrolase n=1 Tax=Agarivorans sp. QJM3NY_33 TaxID=3421432 RepID=UPI003D7D8CE9